MKQDNLRATYQVDDSSNDYKKRFIKNPSFKKLEIKEDQIPPSPNPYHVSWEIPSKVPSKYYNNVSEYCVT